ncbi:hypothetical protein [Chitinilyticum litopenaei]|uniref:hypothetical protein n=1 Tax=Chitinilyticum litopenaei TaxID=1121276 RepID=UPI00041E051F|nr:hypothetical protein [Chitinilyticum litopenaei]
MSEVLPLLALKLVLVPALMGGISLAARRWGNDVAGFLSAFPVVAGPILLLLALEHGVQFAAQAARGTLAAVLAVMAFALVYVWMARRRGPLPAATAAFVVYALAIVLLYRLAMPDSVLVLLVIAALLLAPRFVRYSGAAPSGLGRRAIVLRMLASAGLVLLVTSLSATLGAGLSGLFAMFPVMAAVLLIGTHLQQDAAQLAACLRGMVLGWPAFALFCLLLWQTLPALGVLAGFALAFGAAAALQSVLGYVARAL